MIIVLKPRTTEENLNRVIKMVETKGLEAAYSLNSRTV